MVIVNSNLVIVKFAKRLKSMSYKGLKVLKSIIKELKQQQKGNFYDDDV